MRGAIRLLLLVLACASSLIVARAESPAALPKPGPEVKKLGVMVGRFKNEGEVKAGALGPNSPAMKVSGIDECSWTAGGLGLVCTEELDIGGTKETGTFLLYYNSISRKYEAHGVLNTGQIENQTGTVSGDTWTWLGEGAAGTKLLHTRYIVKFVSNDSYEYTDEWGEGEKPMELRMSGKATRVAVTKPAASKPAQ